MGKIGNIKSKVEEVPFSLYSLFVNIDGISNRLKCIKRNSDRKNDVNIRKRASIVEIVPDTVDIV